MTDKRIIRYFMTISEATELVLQAGAMAHQNELYVLDMGRPVKILDLAENMIRLSGYVPYRDIDIIETGLRPARSSMRSCWWPAGTLKRPRTTRSLWSASLR